MLVVNKRGHRPTANDVYVGRPSVLGNPYAIGDRFGTREEVIQRYRHWLHRRLVERNPQVVEAIERLTDDSILVCWCAPLACHGTVIADAREWWRARSQG